MIRVFAGLAVVAVVALSGCGGTRATPSIGSSFQDPENDYTIQVDPTWEYQAGGVAQGIEFWLLGPADGGFRPNLNLLTQSAPGLSLADYTTMSLRNAPAMVSGFTLISNTPVDSELELMEYTANAQGRSLHFLAIFGVHSGRAVVATLTTLEASFAAWRARVEPFMLTLRLT